MATRLQIDYLSIQLNALVVLRVRHIAASARWLFLKHLLAMAAVLYRSKLSSTSTFIGLATSLISCDFPPCTGVKNVRQGAPDSPSHVVRGIWRSLKGRHPVASKPIGMVVCLFAQPLSPFDIYQSPLSQDLTVSQFLRCSSLSRL